MDLQGDAYAIADYSLSLMIAWGRGPVAASEGGGIALLTVLLPPVVERHRRAIILRRIAPAHPLLLTRRYR